MFNLNHTEYVKMSWRENICGSRPLCRAIRRYKYSRLVKIKAKNNDSKGSTKVTYEMKQICSDLNSLFIFLPVNLD